MRSITIISEDRVGLLADISYILGKSNINIDGLNVDVVGKKAIIALVIKDPKRAAGVLHRNGYQTAEMDSIVVKIPNEPGELGRVAENLSKERVNVENMHLLSSDSNGGVFALTVDKPRKASKLLSHILITNGVDTVASL
jgi:hypothetical protein